MFYNKNMGNTVGSREPLVAFTARKTQTLWVRPQQMEILIGSILGDAYVSPQGKIQLEHSIKQKEYLMWKYQELASISYPGPPALVLHKAGKTDKKYEALRFWTRQFFRPLRSRFYKNNQKIFPSDLKLTPMILAVWHMDDGHYDSHKNRCTLATDNFNRKSISQILKNLEESFSIIPVLRPNGKLVFHQENQTRFFDLIRPYTIPSMRYKIH